MNIDFGRLPTKLYRSTYGTRTTARYFVDKYPIFLPAGPALLPPVVSFCFVDEGLKGSSHFETFLCQYQALLLALPEFHVVYVAAGAAPPIWAEPTLERFLAKVGGGKALAKPPVRRIAFPDKWICGGLPKRLHDPPSQETP